RERRTAGGREARVGGAVTEEDRYLVGVGTGRDKVGLAVTVDVPNGQPRQVDALGEWRVARLCEGAGAGAEQHRDAGWAVVDGDDVGLAVGVHVGDGQRKGLAADGERRTGRRREPAAAV